MKIDFFNLLFEQGEHMCFGLDPYETKVSSMLLTHKQFFSINPLKISRKDFNVTSYRNFLFEIDDAGLSPEEQLKFFIDKKKTPLSAATFSGGKSVHCIISLAEPCATAKEYRELWHRIHTALDGIPDRSTSNPSRFSRTPGAIRVGVGVEQRLLYLAAERVTRAELEEWLLTNNSPVVERVEIERVPLPPGMKGILSGWTERFIAMGAADGEWNLSLFKSSCDAFRNNYSRDEWIAILEKFHVELDRNDIKTIHSAERSVSDQE